SSFAHLANRTAPLCCRARSRVYLQTSGSPPRALVGHVSLVLEPEAIRPETERATVIAERGTVTAEGATVVAEPGTGAFESVGVPAACDDSRFQSGAVLVRQYCRHLVLP